MGQSWPARTATTTRRATADVDMYIGPNDDTPVLGVYDGQDAWVWGEYVSGCD